MIMYGLYVAMLAARFPCVIPTVLISKPCDGTVPVGPKFAEDCNMVVGAVVFPGFGVYIPPPRDRIILLGITPAATLIEKLHDWPAMFMVKDAVPDEDGVPEIARDILPFPLANVPAWAEAVSPITPEEAEAIAG